MLKKNMLLLSCFTLLTSLFTLEATAATFKLPDTGQTKCYDPSGSTTNEIPCAGTGQDGAYAPRNPMSFIDNGNGTVTDNNTALTWQKCSVGQNNDASCSGTAAGYNWYQATGTYDASYNSVSQNICGSLALASGGWRLPSKKELITIVDYSIPYPGPTIRQGAFPNTVASGYWSSTTYAYSSHLPYNAWYVHFGDGAVGSNYKDVSYYVRCVRGGQ